MLTRDELEQIGKVVEEKIQASEARVTKKIEASLEATESRLTKKIEVTQKDTINALSEVIQTGYNLHEERIRAIEDHVDIPHPKEN